MDEIKQEIVKLLEFLDLEQLWRVRVFVLKLIWHGRPPTRLQ